MQYIHTYTYIYVSIQIYMISIISIFPEIQNFLEIWTFQKLYMFLNNQSIYLSIYQK